MAFTGWNTQRDYRSRLGGRPEEQQTTTTALPDPTAPGTNFSSGGYEDWRNQWQPSAGGFGGGGTTSASSMPGPYGDEAWSYWKSASATPGMTPEQIATMRSQALNAQASANKGMTERIREMMAAQGLGNSGMENRMMAQQMLGSEANLQGALNQQALAAAEAERMGRQNYAQMGLQGAGTLGSLNLQQQNIGNQAADLDARMRMFFDQSDWNKYKDYQSNQLYNRQQEELEPYRNRLAQMFSSRPGTRGLGGY